VFRVGAGSDCRGAETLELLLHSGNITVIKVETTERVDVAVRL
jgi:hypothetical protein